MIKILEDLKRDDKKLYLQVEKQLDYFGSRSSKGHFLRLTYLDFLDYASFANSYTFQLDDYDMVVNVLADLSPADNKMMIKIQKSKASDKKALIAECIRANNRTRQRVLVILDNLTKTQPTSIIDHLTSFKKKVFA